VDREHGSLLEDVVTGLVAGLVATKVTGLAQQALYRPMPERIKRREARVRPDKVSAQDAAGLLFDQRLVGVDRLGAPIVRSRGEA